MAVSIVTPPHHLKFHSLSSSSPAIRKNPTSPYSIPRYSPYKLSTGRLSTLLGHPHSHPLPTPPALNLPVTSQPPITFEYESSSFQATTHVELGFSLYSNGVQINPNKEQVNAILDLFPTAFNLSIQNPLIVVTCLQLPPKPWPLTIAEMPLYLTTDSNTIPLKLGLGARGPKIEIDYPDHQAI